MYLVLEKDILIKEYNFTGVYFLFFSFYCTTAMNVHQGYEGARNEAFLSLHWRRVPHTTDDPPPLFVTALNFLNNFRKIL